MLPRIRSRYLAFCIAGLVGLALTSLAACEAEQVATSTPRQGGRPVEAAPTASQATVQSLATRAEVRATPTPAVPTTVAAASLGPGLHDFTLPDAHGGTVTLSQYLGKKTVVLTFYRAWW